MRKLGNPAWHPTAGKPWRQDIDQVRLATQHRIGLLLIKGKPQQADGGTAFPHLTQLSYDSSGEQPVWCAQD